jgi:hypothetical protein
MQAIEYEYRDAEYEKAETNTFWLDQTVELLDQRAKAFQSRFDRLWTGHIDPRIAQQIQRIFRTTRSKKPEILLKLPCPTLENPLRQSDRGR